MRTASPHESTPQRSDTVGTPDCRESMSPSFAFHGRLNSPETVPGGWYRRNAPQYEMLSYVNHVIALQLAGDWENVTLFVRRAAKYLSSSSAECLTPEYRALAADFLRAVIADAGHEDLGKFGLEFVEEARGLLPAAAGA